MKSREERTQRERNRVARRKAEGGCVRCSNPTEPGKTLCKHHLRGPAPKKAPKPRATSRARRDRFERNGMCRDCGKHTPRPGLKSCSFCAHAQMQRRNPERIKPRFGGKRGRVMRTDKGRTVSHEQVTMGALKAAVRELVEYGVCECGRTILACPGQGSKPIRCAICTLGRRREYVRNHKRKNGIVPKYTRRGAEYTEEEAIMVVEKRRQKQREASAKRRAS